MLGVRIPPGLQDFKYTGFTREPSEFFGAACSCSLKNKIGSGMFNKIVSFIREVRTEMARVTWPTRDELQNSTTVVILVSIAFAVFIFFVDNILKYLFDLLYGF